MNNGLHMVAFILVVVGGLNWLLVGLFQWDIGQIFGGMDALLSRVIYLLVGVSAVYLAATYKKMGHMSNSAPSSPMGGGMKM